MRFDMAKVLCEEPRSGGVKEKGLNKNFAKQMANDGELTVKRESNSPKRKYDRKTFGEHLGPLKGYVLSCVGRKWDDVYSELCSHIDKNNVVQKHILTHIWDYVEKDVWLKNGKVYLSKPKEYYSRYNNYP